MSRLTLSKLDYGRGAIRTGHGVMSHLDSCRGQRRDGKCGGLDDARQTSRLGPGNIKRCHIWSKANDCWRRENKRGRMRMHGGWQLMMEWHRSECWDRYRQLLTRAPKNAPLDHYPHPNLLGSLSHLHLESFHYLIQSTGQCSRSWFHQSNDCRPIASSWR